MYSYVIEFNLAHRGEQAEEYLEEAVRTWPKLWNDIPGVCGTLLLSSAFALGGDFEYQLRADIENLATLSTIDKVMKTDHTWARTRKKWFKARIATRATVSKVLGGSETYCEPQKGADAAIHLVFNSPSGESGRASDRLKAVESARGVVAAQAVRIVAGANGFSEQTWLRLGGLDQLDEVSDIDLGEGVSHVFGELREVDGSLFAGA